MPTRFLVLAFALSATVLVAQATPRTGKVVDRNGDPVAHTSVIDRETLDAARTDDDGTFTIELPESGSVTFAVVAPGKEAVDRAVELKQDEPLVLRLELVATPQLSMDAVTVGAPRAAASTSTRGAAMTALDVVTLPGAAAGINRALQTLPGVQNVDEGDALFVRGGDYWETGAFINGSLFPSAVRLEAPTGTFVGTVNAFLTKSITFTAGGFGARYGNLLSGVVALDTQDAPVLSEGTLNVGLGAFSIGGATPLGKTAGIRFAATSFDLEPSMKLNGSNFHFEPPPKGSDVSGSVVWNYRPGAQLKFFAIQQANHLGVQVDEPSYQGLYTQYQRNRFAVLSLKDSAGPIALSASASAGMGHSTEKFGDLEVETRLPTTRSSVQGTYSQISDVAITAGAEYERTGLRMIGRKPASFDALAPGAAGTDVQARVDGVRDGAFVEADWIATDRLHIVSGVRTDCSTLTGERTVDPRLSINYRIRDGVILAGSGGVYHQVADILFYNPGLSGGGLPAMRATHEIVGLQIGEGTRQLRLEAYRKDYDSLIQFTQSRTVSRNGTGSSQGIDLFAKYPLPLGVSARVTMSLLDAQRTDPETGLLSRASFGIRNSTTVILTRNFSGGYQTGISWRAASGRPYTEIVGASYDENRHVFTPTYASPYAGRLPAYQRFDFNISKIKQQTPKVMTVWYVALSNILGEDNVSGYTYSADYTERKAKPSLFNRSVYFGLSFIYR